MGEMDQAKNPIDHIGSNGKFGAAEKPPAQHRSHRSRWQPGWHASERFDGTRREVQRITDKFRSLDDVCAAVLAPLGQAFGTTIITRTTAKSRARVEPRSQLGIGTVPSE